MDEDVGAVIRRTRRARGLSLRELAAAAFVTKGYLSRVERGLRQPSVQVLRMLGEVLGVELPEPVARPYPGRVPTSGTVALVPVRQPDGSVVVVRMDRRAFLASAGAAAAVTAIPLPDRITPDVLTALSDRLDWHVAAGRTIDPDSVSRLLRADLGVCTAVAQDTPSALRPRILGLCARYAEFLGWMRQEAGDRDDALFWTDRAADYAQAAGWRHMVSYTSTRKALVVLADQPRHAVDLAQVARGRPWQPSAGLAALAASQEAEALALLGRDGDAHRAMDTAHRFVARIDLADEPPVGPRAKSVAQIVAARAARADLYLGRPEPAVEYLAPVVAAASNAKWRATDGALLARAYAGLGAVDEACRSALQATQDAQACVSATARQELRELRGVLAPWAHRSDVSDVLAALPA